jgi:hypothetical protein
MSLEAVTVIVWVASLIRGQRRTTAPLWCGSIGAILGLLAYVLALSGRNLDEFFSVAAQVTIGVLIAIALEVRKDEENVDAVVNFAVLQFVGLATVLAGALFALTGLLLSPEANVAVAIAFGMTWGGLLAGFATLVLLAATSIAEKFKLKT